MNYAARHLAWDCAYVLREDWPLRLSARDRLFVEVAFQQGPDAVTLKKARRLFDLADVCIGVRT